MKKFRQLFKDMDKLLLLITIILFVFGLLNIVTASAKISVMKYTQSLYHYFFKQLIAIGGGIFLSLILIKIPTKKYGAWMKVIGLGVFLMLGYLLLYGKAWSGNINWIAIPGFGSVQPSEFAKPVMIIFLAYLFQKYNYRLKSPNKSHWNEIGVIAFAGIIFPAMVFLQNDLGTTIILSVIFALMFIVSPILKTEKIKTILVVLFVMMAFIIVQLSLGNALLSDKQKERFDFYNPCSDYYDGGYQICNGFIAINDGGLLGVGIGNSKQVSYIPESHTDSVFAIIAEEYGLIVCTFILIAYLIIIFKILKLASIVNDLQNRYICFGIAIYLFLHIIINLGGLFGIMPLTGVPLPFLSYGGSFAMTLCCVLTVVQRINIEHRNEKIVV